MPEILYRDDDIAVLNKPSDVSLLADRSGAENLWQALPAMLGTRPYLVHRLDKPTSGVLVVALTRDAQRTLTRAFGQRRVRKYYLAWVTGDPPLRGRIDLPLKPGRKRRYRVAGQRADILHRNGCWSLPGPPDPDGHQSLTRFRKLAQRTNRALLLLAPLTGRTHQLRVHLAWIGHPILGDALYGRPGDPGQRADRLLLHSHRLVVPGIGSWAARHTVGWPG